MRLNKLVVAIVEKATQILRGELLDEAIEKHGTDLEPVVVKALDLAKEDFPSFDIEIILISGQKFPDIILKINDCKIGIEIKTTKSDKWVTLGGSITESTKVSELEDIFVLFGRTNVNPPEFRFRRFSECAKSVKITHSPRFTIDMETPVGESVFEHIGIPYEELNERQDKMKLFRRYLKERAGPNADVWWLEGEIEVDEANGFETDAIRSFDSLSKSEKESLKTEVLAIFPQLFDLTSTYKYHSPTRYVAARHGIVDHCFRDRFTSGGRISWPLYGDSVPKVIENLIKEERLIEIFNKLDTLPIQVLEEYWMQPGQKIEAIGRRRLWIESVIFNIGRSETALAEYLRPILSQYL